MLYSDFYRPRISLSGNQRERKERQVLRYYPRTKSCGSWGWWWYQLYWAHLELSLKAWKLGLEELKIGGRAEAMQTTAWRSPARITRRVSECREESWISEKTSCPSDSGESRSSNAGGKKTQRNNNNTNNDLQKNKKTTTMEHGVVGDTNCNRCARHNQQKTNKKMETRGLVKTTQRRALLRPVRILRRVLETSGDLNSSGKPQAKAGMKNS